MMRSASAISVLLLLVLTACGGETSVGANLETEFQAASDAPRLGERSEAPSPTPDEPEQASPEPATEQPASTTEPPPEPATAPTSEEAAAAEPVVSLEVSINSDTAGSGQFDPSLARVFTSSCIRWTNADSVPRSVIADDGSFDSGELAPGGTFVYCFEVPGKFNYHDGTRPYAVAAVEVIAQ